MKKLYMVQLYYIAKIERKKNYMKLCALQFVLL